MGRKASSVQKLRQSLKNARNARLKKELEREMHYCPKCGWGWSADEGDICPNCGFDMKNAEELAEKQKDEARAMKEAAAKEETEAK